MLACECMLGVIFSVCVAFDVPFDINVTFASMASYPDGAHSRASVQDSMAGPALTGKLPIRPYMIHKQRIQHTDVPADSAVHGCEHPGGQTPDSAPSGPRLVQEDLQVTPGLGLLHRARHLCQALPAAPLPAITRSALLPALGLPPSNAIACVACAASPHSILGMADALFTKAGGEMLAIRRAWLRRGTTGVLAQVQRAQAGQLRDEAHEAHVAAVDARAHVAALAAAAGLGHLEQTGKNRSK